MTDPLREKSVKFAEGLDRSDDLDVDEKLALLHYVRNDLHEQVLAHVDGKGVVTIEPVEKAAQEEGVA